MSDYAPTTDFSIKDGLITGDPNKIIKGSDFDVEFEAIETAIASKADTTSFSASSGSDLVGFVNTGTSVVATTVQSKLRETVSVKDFGAIGDGVTDDYAAFLACVTAVNTAGGGTVYIPAGTYLLGTPLQMKGFENVHIIGAGRGATVLTKDDNFAAASIRFYMGTNNSIRHLTLDCDGYDGRGIFLQDIGTWAEDVEVLNCPSRPFSMNGGGNASYGLDTDGSTEDDAGWDSTPVFYPARCKFIRCYVYNAGQTAYSCKRMQYYEVVGCYAELVYSEGVTLDVFSNYSTVAFNTLKNVCRSDSSEAFPDKVAGSGYLSVGTGGTGGIGIDNNYYSKVIGNSVIDVQDNITAGSKAHPALNFVNNIGKSEGIIVIGNHFENADVGVLFKGTGDGAEDNTYNSIVSENTFVDVATEIQIQAGNTGNKITGNVAPTELGLVIIENSTDNFITDSGYANTLTIEGNTSAGTGTYVANQQRIKWERNGKTVTFSGIVGWTAHDGTGVMKLVGLPYTNSSYEASTVFCACDDMTVTGQLVMFIPAGTNYGLFYVVNDGARTNKNIEATGTIWFSGSYQAA